MFFAAKATGTNITSAATSAILTIHFEVFILVLLL
jgi:hypothetical protein